MIEDCVSVPPGTCLETDLCIVGAGAAGLAIAAQLEGTRHRICILESGGLKYEHTRQRLSRGRNVGTPYEALDLCRIRQFGGSTGRAGWGGWCKPLDGADFETRPWIPLSGWPFDRQSLMPFYGSAAQLLGVDLLADWPVPAMFPDEGPLVSERCFLSPSPHLGDTLRNRLHEASNVTVLLHATALRLDTDATGTNLQSIEVASLPSRRFRVSAKAFVLACGGIENARLLLVSDRQNPTGLGNRHDLVGRHFMEHPRVRWGRLDVRRPDERIAVHVPSSGSSNVMALNATSPASGAFGLALRPAIRADEGLLDSRTWIRRGPCVSHLGGSEALQYLAFWLRKGRLHRDLIRSGRTVLRHPAGAVSAAIDRVRSSRGRATQFHFDTILEQDPDPASRVTLDTKRDEFGLPRVKLDWRVGPLVRRTLERVQTLIAEEMSNLGYRAEIQSSPHQKTVFGQDVPYRWVRHHMGTTRMSNDPRTGVVDSSCRVHDVRNLFIAGSSVFPTGGNDMPTLTIVALAIKLGQHLQQFLE